MTLLLCKNKLTLKASISVSFAGMDDLVHRLDTIAGVAKSAQTAALAAELIFRQQALQAQNAQKSNQLVTEKANALKLMSSELERMKQQVTEKTGALTLMFSELEASHIGMLGLQNELVHINFRNLQANNTILDLQRELEKFSR